MVSYQSAKEEIKRAADITELIGQFVQLRKVGRNYTGLCPFHSEKAPSFTVSPEKQMFHCFGCKKGGDIFAFWMEYHSATFLEALRDLGERYNVTIPEGPGSVEEREKAGLREALFEVNKKAVAYFRQSLNHSLKGKRGREYIERRLLPKKTVSEFLIGYAPDEWEGLTGFLSHNRVDLEKAFQAGLIIPKKGGGYYDRFRGRIIFPIFNMRQQVVGFGGRVLDDSLPKYLNTPETPIFHKGEFPYGLHATYQTIREKQRVVIVEGYMDFLALRGSGLGEVVATLGTALTSEYVRKLKGYADEAVMVFDSDEAGKAAVSKSLSVFLNEGLSARAVVLPEGHDPDSFVNSYGLSQFLELLNGACPLFDFFLEQKAAQRVSDVEGKARVLKEVLPVISELRSSTQRSLYVQRLSERIGVREEVVLAELRASGQFISRKNFERDMKEHLAVSKVERRFGRDFHLLNLMIHFPQAVLRLKNCEWKVLLSEPAVTEIVETFFENYPRGGSFSHEELLENLQNEDARKLLREALLLPSFYSDQMVELAVVELEEKVRQIKISASIQKAKESGDIESLNQLLKLKAQRPVKP